MGSRNRTAGNNYEREIVNRYNNFGFTGKEGEFAPLFPRVGTTRNLSTAMDAMKVDVTTEDPRQLEQFGLLIQAKNTTNTATYPKLLKEMEPAVERYGGIPVVYHKQTERTGKDGTVRFVKRGEYVSLNASAFENMYTKLRVNTEVIEEFMSYFDSFPEEVQAELNNFLKERNL